MLAKLEMESFCIEKDSKYPHLLIVNIITSCIDCFCVLAVVPPSHSLCSFPSLFIPLPKSFFISGQLWH